MPPITEFLPVQDGTPAVGSLVARLDAILALLPGPALAGTPQGAAKRALYRLIEDVEREGAAPVDAELIVEPGSTIALLQALVDEVRGLRAQMGSTAGVSSVEVKTSTRGVDVAAKSYDGTDVGAQVNPAVDAYFATLQAVQERLNGDGGG